MTRKRQAPGFAKISRNAWATWEALQAMGDVSLVHVPDGEAARIRERYANAKTKLSAFIGAVGSLNDAVSRAERHRRR